MNLNTLSPAVGSKTNSKRVGRGIGSGLGKTSTRGHKGQKSRAGGFKINFEGGQMPIQRRLPKFGFKSRIARTVTQIRLSQLQPYMSEIIDLAFLKSQGLVKKSIRSVKIIHSGNIGTALKIRGLKITKGARAALEQAGGHIEE